MVNNTKTSKVPEPFVRSLRNYSSILKISHELGVISQPFKRALEIAYRAGARHCLQWKDYENLEWRAESQILYSHVYPPQPDYVIRLDFFRSNPIKDQDKDAGHIGYVCLRPGPKLTVVECTVKPPSDVANHYLLCTSTCKTKYPISDTEFIDTEITGACTFVQQDGAAGVCAHACLRIMSLSLSCSYSGCDAMTVEEIQKKAALMPLLEGSHMPSSGLREAEIAAVVEEMKATPHLYWFEKGQEERMHLTFEQVVYPYIESQIPVMVCIDTEKDERHVVVVVGHTFDRDSWWQQAEIGYYPTLAGGTTWIPSYMWSPEFIVHDDNFGPYLSVSRTLLRLTTSSIIIPIPQSCHVFLTGYQAESLAANYLTSTMFCKYILQETYIKTLWRNLVEEIETGSNLVLRPLLVSREALITHLASSEISQQLVEIYKQAKLSPWVWLIEVSVPQLYSQRKKIGEIIINASYPWQHIQTGIEPLIALRIFDVIILSENFAQPQLTKDRHPTSVLTRVTFDKA
jgi:hypothetical protein